MSDSDFETNAVRGQFERSQHREHSVPLYLTSSFVFEDAEQARALFADEIPGNIYTRFSNPNTTEFINKLCLMEGTEDGIATASGMAAMYISMASQLKSGDHILASRSLFGSTHQILTVLFPRFGITHSYVDIQDSHEKWEQEIRPNTRMIFVETPSNPALGIIDLEWLGALAKKRNVILNVDNCFTTPYLQNPAKWGAHLVTHSATKFIDGQGRVIGGAVLGTKELIKEVRFFARHTGPSMSPFNEIKAFLSAYDPTVQAIALEARALVLKLVPTAVEQIDVPAKMLAYGFAATYKDMICVIMPQKTYVNLGLPRGATLPDPAKLLTGTGKKARHVKLTDAKAADTPQIRALIEASVAQIKK